MIGASPLWAYDWSVSFSKMISLPTAVRTCHSKLSGCQYGSLHLSCLLKTLFGVPRLLWSIPLGINQWRTQIDLKGSKGLMVLRASAVVPIYPTNLFEVINIHASSRGMLMKLHLSFGLSPPQEKLSQSMWWNCADRARMLMRTSQKLS